MPSFCLNHPDRQRGVRGCSCERCEAHRVYMRERYAADPGREREKQRRLYAGPGGERRRAGMRRRYENLTGVEYNRRLLQIRRQKALKRMAERNARGQSTGPGGETVGSLQDQGRD